MGRIMDIRRIKRVGSVRIITDIFTFTDDFVGVTVFGTVSVFAEY